MKTYFENFLHSRGIAYEKLVVIDNTIVAFSSDTSVFKDGWVATLHG